MCSSCLKRKSNTRGLCKSCYNKDYWSRATPEQLEKRRRSVQENYRLKKQGTFKRKIALNPTPQQRRDAQNASTRARREFIKHLLNDIKLQLGCVDCGYREAAVALDFDHIGEKGFGIARAVGSTVGLDRLLSEIAKCEVRCANCHRIVTKERRGRTLGKN